jgi:hypothetical protein
MSNTIDVLVTFDAEGIIATFGPNGDPNNPVQIPVTNPPQWIFMVTDQAGVLSGQGGSELNVTAQTEDTIRWREVTPGPDYESILYAFDPTGGGNLISTPQAMLATVTEPLPNPANPTVPNRQTVQDYLWNCVVTGAGQVTYHFSFMIVDRAGNVQGYYWWDPFITINDPARATARGRAEFAAAR